MGKLLNIIPVSDLRQDAAKVLKQLIMAIGFGVLPIIYGVYHVMLSVETFKQSEHERELLSLLAKGEREIGIGEGYDLEAVLAEADSLLTGEPS